MNEKVDINVIKQWKKDGIIAKHIDALALTISNDPFYIQAGLIKKAHWFYDIWSAEKEVSDWEDDKIHVRALHYQILGKKYTFELQDKHRNVLTIEYGNTEQSWNYLVLGAKYARYLGLVPYEAIRDEQNPPPENVLHLYNHNEFERKYVDVYNGYYDYSNPYINESNIDEFIETAIEAIVKDLFINISYHADSEQPNYLEIWAEKKGVIPKQIARDFNITMRPAGGGEFSVDMCYHAVKRAKDLDKSLHIFVLSDYDPKGEDMPKSVARKVEFLAKEMDVTAFVHHVALTKEQCIQYSLPTDPTKQPKNNNKGYITQSNIWKESAGQDPTEINSFQSRDSKVYKETIRNAITPYFDKELAEKYRKELNRIKTEVSDKLREYYNKRRDELNEVRIELIGKVDSLTEKLDKLVKETKDELDFDQTLENFYKLLQIDTKNILKDVEFEHPEINVEMPEKALLDTRRTYLEQIKAYKAFDFRTKKT